jgi:hypothetical protein
MQLKAEVSACLSVASCSFTKVYACNLIFKTMRALGINMVANGFVHVACAGQRYMIIPTEAVLGHVGLAPSNWKDHKGTVGRLYLRWYTLGRCYTPDTYFLLYILLFSPGMPRESDVKYLSSKARQYMFSKSARQVAIYLGLDQEASKALENVCLPT